MARFLILVALVGVISPTFVQCLDEENAKEQACFPIKKTVSVDLKFLESMKPSYYPLMSRLDLYRVAQHISKKEFKDISEYELYYESCMEFGGDPKGQSLGTGFNGKNSTVAFKEIEPSLQKFEISSVGEDESFTETCYSIMTDNKTYTVSACCMSDNQMTWGVASNMKKLPQETIAKIHEYVESIGFKREYFTGLRYDSCP